jgi:hypothetical protein
MMAIEYDVTTNAGQVRLLIGDTVDSGHLFEDAEIAAFLSLNGDNVRLAAAQALEAIAANQVMVLKVIRRLDLSTDGAAVARELRQQASSLRDQAESGIDDPEGLFGIAELGVDIFGRREILANRALRGVL